MRLSPAVAFTICAVIWGGSWVAIRAAVEGANPIGIAALRTSLAFVLLGLVGLAARLPLPTLPGIARAMAVGVVFLGANFALVYWGAPRISGGIASLLYATTPLQAAVLGSAWGLTRPDWRTIAGAVLGVAAIATAFADVAGVAGISLLAALAVTLGATTSAAGSVMARKWNTLHPLWLNVFANLSAGIVLWAQYFVTGRGGAVPTTTGGWIGFAYMLVGASMIAFAAYFSLLRDWDPARASFTTLTTPFLALGAGAVFYEEPIVGGQIIGGILLIVAGYVALIRPGTHPARTLAEIDPR